MCIDRGLNAVQADQEEIRRQVADVQQVADLLDPANGSQKRRHARFVDLRDEFRDSGAMHQQHLSKVMASFEPGLFVGRDRADWPQDNLDLERWFRQPKSHERRIHGHRHAGVRIVQEGPTLVLALDAHLMHDGLFTAEELHPYRHSPMPPCQHMAIRRRKIMRKARSKKKRRSLLQELERRYLAER
jgi:hypothetical protein